MCFESCSIFSPRLALIFLEQVTIPHYSKCVFWSSDDNAQVGAPHGPLAIV